MDYFEIDFLTFWRTILHWFCYLDFFFQSSFLPFLGFERDQSVLNSKLFSCFSQKTEYAFDFFYLFIILLENICSEG